MISLDEASMIPLNVFLTRLRHGNALISKFRISKIGTSLAGNRTPAAAVKTPNPSH